MLLQTTTAFRICCSRHLAASIFVQSSLCIHSIVLPPLLDAIEDIVSLPEILRNSLVCLVEGAGPWEGTPLGLHSRTREGESPSWPPSALAPVAGKACSHMAGMLVLVHMVRCTPYVVLPEGTKLVAEHEN